MSSISLAAYAVRFRETRHTGHLPLGEVSQNGAYGFVGACLAELQDHLLREEEDQTLLRTTALAPDPEHSKLVGTVASGAWGYEADLLEMQTGELAYRRQVTDAEVLPFFFLFSLPPDRDEGIALLARFGARGIKTVVSKMLQERASDQDLGVQIEFRSLVPSDLLMDWLHEGRITAVRFITYHLQPDLADQVQLGDHEEGSTELILRAGRNRSFPFRGRLRRIFERGVAEVGDLPLMEQPEAVKLDVRLGSRRRRFDVRNLGKVRAYYDVSEDVVIEETGHPNFASMLEAAEDLLRDLNTELYG